MHCWFVQPAVLFNTTVVPVPWGSGPSYSQGKYVDRVAKIIREHGPVAACMNARWGWHDYTGGVGIGAKTIAVCRDFSPLIHCPWDFAR